MKTIYDLTAMIQMLPSSDDHLHTQIAHLLAKNNLSTQINFIQPFIHGGNNRTYKISTADGFFAVKRYFRQNSDKRDRLIAEFLFLSYATQIGIENVPKPYSYDKGEGLALYEYVNGLPLLANEITKNEIDKAAQFFCALNDEGARMHAANLLPASESCFTLSEHLSVIGNRIASLEDITSTISEDHSAEQIIKQLKSVWRVILIEIETKAKTEKIDLHSRLTPAQTCVSPSDFGFHNALRMNHNKEKLYFLDFEYAGLDDPAKMVGDFFAQLAVPVPAHYFEYFLDQVMQVFTACDYLKRRARLLRPLYQIKWCCIALNVFIPVHLARRRFANPELNIAQLKQAQLTKAEHLLQKLEERNYG